MDFFGPFKQRIKALPYPALMSLYYAWYASWHRPKFEYTRARHGLSPLAKTDLSRIKTSDTVFILGSGASINRISERRFEGIARHDSFGFNFWLIHRHVPSLYAFEALPIANDPFRARMAARLIAQADARAADYAGTLKLLTDVMPERTEFLERIPPAFKNNLYTLATVPALARTSEELAYNIEFLIEAGLFEPTAHVRTLFKYRATLSMLISLAVRMGYRRIVLCGIDLNTPDYFFQDAERYPEMAAFDAAARKDVHTTLVRKPMLMPIDMILMEMKKQILDPAKIELYVEHAASALHPALPVAPAHLFEP